MSPNMKRFIKFIDEVNEKVNLVNLQTPFYTPNNIHALKTVYWFCQGERSGA